MLFDNNDNYEKRHFFYSIFIPIGIGIIMILSFILEKGMDWDFHTASVFPRKFETILGIFPLIFIHADWTHLLNNVISFVLLASLLYFFYSEIATKILLISYIFSGFALWIIGRENWHIGASGLIYSLAFFLFFSGVFRKHIPLISISLIITFVYGNMVWHIFPWELNDPVSWEGHLAGGVVGLILSVCYRNKGPQIPEKVWDEDDTNAEESEDCFSEDEDDKMLGIK